MHESAQDNPIGSGFSYPIQTVLARPAAPGFVVPEPSTIPDSEGIYRRYGERQQAFLQGQIDQTRQRLLDLSTQGKRIGIFGAGPHTVEFFRTLQLSPSVFTLALDNNPRKIGKRIRGLEIVRPTAESVSQLDAVLVSSAEFEDAMVAQIESFGAPDIEVLRLYGR